MTPSRRHTQKQVEELRKNLELIEVRKSEYVQATDIPLQLIKTEEETRAKLAALETELRAPETEVRSDKERRLRVLLLLTVLAIGLGAALWAVMQPRKASRVWTPPPVCQPTETARIGLAPLDGCAPSVRTQLMEELQADGDKVHVVLLDTGAASPSPITAASDLDLVVTGNCLPGNAGHVALTFSLITKRTPYELFDPPQVVLTDTVEMASRVGQALSSYQRGDPIQAIGQFRTSSIDAPSREQLLLTANSLLLAGRYDEAIAAYENMVRGSNSSIWSAAYNNLGVARLDQWSLKPEGVPQAGLSDFGVAIALARQGAEPLIEVMAHVNKGWLQDRGGNWSEADASCKAALSLSTQSPLPYLCQIRHALLYNASTDTTAMLPTSDIDRWLDLIEQLNTDFPSLYYYRGYYHMKDGAQASAEADFERFFQAMHYRACLRTEQDRILNARVYMNDLTR